MDPKAFAEYATRTCATRTCATRTCAIAHLRHAHLRHAHLRHAHLRHAHLRHALDPKRASVEAARDGISSSVEESGHEPFADEPAKFNASMVELVPPAVDTKRQH